jgi:hypothetical protein
MVARYELKAELRLRKNATNYILLLRSRAPAPSYEIHVVINERGTPRMVARYELKAELRLRKKCYELYSSLAFARSRTQL